MPNLFKKTAAWRWVPDGDAVNAPDGALLRAHNTMPDKHGARSLRAGSVNIFTGLQEQRVHSLYTPILQSTVWRLAGVDDQAYKNGVRFGKQFDGSGDIAMGDDSYQAFFARGTVTKKFDGINFNNWGIARPSLKPTIVAVSAITSVVASFNSTGEGDVPTSAGNDFTYPEGASNQFVVDYTNSLRGLLDEFYSSGFLFVVLNTSLMSFRCFKYFGLSLVTDI